MLEAAVPLTDLSEGAMARFQGSGLEASDLALLQALGLGDNSRFKVCKTGDPWIVQVRETRIGLAAAVARHIQAVPETAG
jgi:hypothetical protein